MKNFAKILAALLVLVMLIPSVVACGKKKEENKDDPTSTGKRVPVILESAAVTDEVIVVNPNLDLVKDADFAGYPDWAEYKAVYGEYYKYLLAAEAETDASAKYAIQAIAEAKLLEAGVLLPTTTQGGTYAMSRVVPGTAPNVLWGNDQNRYENLVICTDFIKSADRDAIKAEYNKLKGTGEFEGWVKGYLKEKGYTLKDSYTFGYSADPKTWDFANTYLAADTEAIINTYDNLVSYDCEGRLCYALAEDLKVSKDGLTYTFTLRDGLTWQTQNGETYAKLTAQDFVDGLQHVLDLQGGLEYLASVIKNADAYLAGQVEFSEVGIKAIDEKTVEYTLGARADYFPTMLTYNPFGPVCKAYVESKGEAYGTSPENILYCGPYLVENYTPNNKITFKANDKYWAANDINIKTITWLYNDGKDVTKNYNDAIEGVVDGTGLSATTAPMAKEKKTADGKSYFEAYSYVSGTDATTYSVFANVKRGAYATEGYPTLVSPKSDAQKTAAADALKNQNFRLAVMMSVDRGAYNAPSMGDDLKLNNVRNTYTPGTFVSLSRPVQIKIGDTEKTYPAGTYYGQIVQDQITADGYKMQVWDPKGGSTGGGSSDGFEGWYNPTEAKALLDKAIAEGVKATAAAPICLDMPAYMSSATYAARGNALKQSVESALGGLVQINLVDTGDIYGWYYAGYYCNLGEECNYDLYDCSGWGPDYGDPATYLNTMKPDGGDMIHVTGLN